ncbi:MAG: Uma2 family endonuclease [Verrucomicrobia bacterium]|nr:Uma2 family endonuclease [Verrucomicrobiota bacterium]
MSQRHAPPVTRSDYMAMREGPPYYQVVEGDLVMSPSPETYHQDIAGNIYFLIRSYLDRHAVGTVLFAPLDLFLDDVDVYQPDSMFVSTARRSIITDHGLEGAPDLVVEVLSPGTARLDQGAKRTIYARAGVRELWLVDPRTKTVAVFRLPENAETPAATYGVDAVFESPLFPSLKFGGASIFKSSRGS